MKSAAVVLTVAMFLAFAPLLGSGSYGIYNTVNLNGVYSVHADGFDIVMNSSSPQLAFYRDNSPSFIVNYTALYLYSSSRSDGYKADLSGSDWKTTVSNTTEEDGTMRTVVTMSSVLDMASPTKTIPSWGELTFRFFILTKGDRAQLGISTHIDNMTATSCSHIALSQDITGNASIANSDELIVSGVYYRWDRSARVLIGDELSEVPVSTHYYDGKLSFVYPYSQNMVEISHYSGRMDFSGHIVIRDYFSDALGYGIGLLAGFGMLGIPYASHKKREKSPFDMDSPIYRK